MNKPSRLLLLSTVLALSVLLFALPFSGLIPTPVLAQGTPVPDEDGDGVPDSLDNCPTIPNAGQTDTDGDGQGNTCDSDDDQDGIADDVDTNPLIPSVAFDDGAGTLGSVVGAGDRTFLISDAVAPGSGVRIKVFAGLLEFRVAVDCQPPIDITVSPGAAYDAIVTCGSARVETVSGTADITTVVNGTTISVAVDGGDTVELEQDPATGAVSVAAINDSVTVTVDGQGFTLIEGQRLHVPTIDIKPGSDPNSINPKSSGKIPVAILSAPGFDAPEEVDVSSITFGRTGNEVTLNGKGRQGVPHCEVDEVNGDGLPDLVCHFETKETGFSAGDAQGILRGQTLDGAPFAARDAIRVLAK